MKISGDIVLDLILIAVTLWIGFTLFDSIRKARRKRNKQHVEKTEVAE